VSGHKKEETPAVRPAPLRRRRFGNVLSYPNMNDRSGTVMPCYYLTSREARPALEKYDFERLWESSKATPFPVPRGASETATCYSIAQEFPFVYKNF